MKVLFQDLGAQHKGIKNKIDRAIKDVLRRQDFILGEDVKLFENEFAGFCDTRFSVGVSSGTAALFLALASLGVKNGDEVIVPDLTFIATALAVSYTGARPVFVDIEEDTYNIDVTKIKKAVTGNTRAIIPVHLFGQPANMPEILKVAKEYNLKVIEDAAQAHGAAIRVPANKWQRVGGLGDAGCFSFYPSKNLGALGDAGMITTNNPEIYKKLLMLRDCGRVSRYEHAVIGYNSRLDTLQAAVLRVKLKRLNDFNSMRRRIAGIYNRLLENIYGVVIPCVSPGVRHVYHAYAIRVKDRDRIYQGLKEKDIGVMIYYPIPLHLQKAYGHLGYKRGDFPVSEKVTQEILALPMHPYLKEAQIDFITEQLRGLIG